MAKGAHKCSKCDRSFSMAAHLARHTNTMHSGKARKAGGGKRKGRGPARTRGAAINAPEGEGATRVLKEMEAYRDTLLMQRSAIEHQIAGLDSAMNAMGGTPAAAQIGRRRGRPAGGGREGSLKQMIVKVLRHRSKPLTPQEIADGVVGAGYKTASKNLTKAVSNALPLLRVVKKIDRGLYQV